MPPSTRTPWRAKLDSYGFRQRTTPLWQEQEAIYTKDHQRQQQEQCSVVRKKQLTPALKLNLARQTYAKTASSQGLWEFLLSRLRNGKTSSRLMTRTKEETDCLQLFFNIEPFDNNSRFRRFFPLTYICQTRSCHWQCQRIQSKSRSRWRLITTSAGDFRQFVRKALSDISSSLTANKACIAG